MRRALDFLLAAWALMVVYRFCAPLWEFEAQWIDRLGIHLALLVTCLGLAAVDTVLCIGRARREGTE